VRALANWLSIAAHPFVMVGIMVATASARLSTRGEAWTSVLVVAGTIVPLLVLMIRQVRRGAWENADASNRQERPILYLVSGVTTAGLLAYLMVVRPESFLVRGLTVTLGMFAVCAVVSRWIKVSLHMAFAALAAVGLSLLGSSVGYALLVVVLPLAWSRLALGRHTPGEVILGAAIGASAAVVMHIA
jgi:membrane-associated phospholipid phosphatase